MADKRLSSGLLIRVEFNLTFILSEPVVYFNIVLSFVSLSKFSCNMVRIVLNACRPHLSCSIILPFEIINKEVSGVKDLIDDQWTSVVVH